MVTDYRSSNTPESIRDLWQTPRWLFNAVNRNLHFVCDIAASSDNKLTHRYITENEDAFKYDFSEFQGMYVWCNPPYSDVTPWIDLAIKNRNEHNVGTVLLIPADTSVRWFSKCVDEADQITFITNGRVNFVRADTGVPVSGNTKGSMLVLFGTERNPNSLLETFYVDRDYLKAEGTE